MAELPALGDLVVLQEHTDGLVARIRGVEELVENVVGGAADGKRFVVADSLRWLQQRLASLLLDVGRLAATADDIDQGMIP